MTMPKRSIQIGLALLLGGAVSLPLYGQTDQKKVEQPEQKKVVQPEQKKEEKKEQKKEDPPTVYKGEIKLGLHTHKMNAGENYVIKVKTKGFQPLIQIRDPNNNNTYFSRGGGSATNNDWTLAFSWTPSETKDYNILIGCSFGQLAKGAMDYTLEISSFKPMFKQTGQINNTDPQYPLRNGCHHKVHTVELKAGTTYQIDMVGNMDPYLYLEDSLGNVLRSDDDGGGNLNSRIIYQPTKTDKYRIVCTTCGGGATGQYTLSVSDTPINVNPNGGIGIGIAPGGGVIGPGGIQPFPQPVPLPRPIIKQLPKIQPQPQPKIQIQPGKVQIQQGIQIQPNGGIQIQIDPAVFPGAVPQVVPAPAPMPDDQPKKN